MFELLCFLGVGGGSSFMCEFESIAAVGRSLGCGFELVLSLLVSLLRGGELGSDVR